MYDVEPWIDMECIFSTGIAYHSNQSDTHDFHAPDNINMKDSLSSQSW